jgi:stringent starvation protein B
MRLFKILALWGMYFGYLITFRTPMLVCEKIVYNIAPEAVRGLFIGWNNVTFLASFQGRVEKVKVPLDDVVAIEG